MESKITQEKKFKIIYLLKQKHKKKLEIKYMCVLANVSRSGYYSYIKRISRPVSRRGNCWDNAPQESFFGYMKDELNIDECKTYEDLNNEINDYMDYYNNHRCQWDLKRMTPTKYRDYKYSQLDIYLKGDNLYRSSPYS